MVSCCVLTSGLATTRGEILDPNDIRSNLNYLTKLRSRGPRVWRRPLRPGSRIIVLSPDHNKTSALPGHLPGGTLRGGPFVLKSSQLIEENVFKIQEKWVEILILEG